MLIILSAQTVNEDIALQFGRMPPSFLPIGDRRLFSAQVELAFGEPCLITLPLDFSVGDFDASILAELGVSVILQPAGLRLTEAIAHALEHARPQGRVRILYGDTIVRTTREDLLRPDVVAAKDTTANYQWAFVGANAAAGCRFSDEPPSRLDVRQVVCGYFTFSDIPSLMAACLEPTIVRALNAYDLRTPLSMIEPQQWFDFGHLPLYMQSKKEMLVKRVFNELTYEKHLLVKQSDDTAKMRAEAHWYENLPDDLQLHTPRYRGRVERNYRAGYALEYLYHPLLSDLATFGELPLTSWLEIVSATFELIQKCHAIRPAPGAPETSPRFAQYFFDSVIVGKTWSRLERYCATDTVNLSDVIELDGVVHLPLQIVVANLIDGLRPTESDDIRFWHGDLFFGNMFYDFTARRTLCIDPRGQIEQGETYLFGDRRYDLAKLAHSLIGHYDRIVLGRSVLVELGPLRWQLTVDERPFQAQLERIFIDFATKTCGVGEDELLRITSLLFFSMLPLHHDRPDLQRKFLAMGLRLSARTAGGML